MRKKQSLCPPQKTPATKKTHNGAKSAGHASVVTDRDVYVGTGVLDGPSKSQYKNRQKSCGSAGFVL